MYTERKMRFAAFISFALMIGAIVLVAWSATHLPPTTLKVFVLAVLFLFVTERAR